MNIRTRLHEKPGPLRQFDWEAWLEGDDGTIGYGLTLGKAIADLVRQVVEKLQKRQLEGRS